MLHSNGDRLDCEQSLFILQLAVHVRELQERCKKQGQQPEKKKERLPAQPEPMKYALASQRKNTIGWCVKCWQQAVDNRNHWQVDDGWSTAGMFVMFPENWHSKIRAKLSEALEALISSRDIVTILRTGSGKNLIFQLFCEVKLALNRNLC